MKSKVIFILVPSYSNNEWLDDKMQQITSSFIDILNIDRCPIEIVNDYNDCNLFLDKADFLVVMTAGVFIIERDHIYNKINSIPNDVGLIAHLLKFKEDRTPYIHEQMFIINTKAVTNINLSFVEYQKYSKELIRSEEDLHDGHAPLSIELGSKITFNNFKFGTNLITHCLERGYKVRNFDIDWRYPDKQNDYVKLKGYRAPSKGFLYPKLNTELFAQCLRTMTVAPGLDEAQQLCINAVNNVLEYKVLNYWHYDSIAKNLVQADLIVCPANGFLAEMMAYTTGAKKIRFYDINSNNINFKKHLYENWDGIDYTDFALQYAKEHDLSLEPTLAIDKAMSKPLIEDTEKLLFPIWDSFKKNIEVEFVVADLLKDTDKILSDVSRLSIVHTSTILDAYPFTAIINSREDISRTKNRILATGAQWIRL